MEQTRIAEGAISGDGGSERKEWKVKFGSIRGKEILSSTTGEAGADLRLLEQGNVLVCMPTQVYFFALLVSFWLLIWILLRSQWDVISQRC